MAISRNAKVVLTWCAAHTDSTATRLVRGKALPVVNLNWHGLARAQGFADDNTPGATRSSLDALDELRAAGLLAHYDEGVTTFGHTTTVFVTQD